MPPVRNGGVQIYNTGYSNVRNPNNQPNNYNNQPSKPLNVDRDDGGIYKAKNTNHYNDAKIIPDNKNMYTDMPVDYKRTDVVHNVS